MQERTQHPERQESHGFLQMVRINGLFLQYVPMEQRSEEVCLTAIEEDAFAYQFVPEPLKQRSAYLAECTVSGHGHVLEHVPEHLKTENVCRLAVYSKGGALKFVPLRLRSEELCDVAMMFAGDLKSVPLPLRTRARCELAVSSWAFSLRAVPDEHLDERMCLLAMQSNGSALHMVPPHLLTERVREAAAEQRGGPKSSFPRVDLEAAVGAQDDLDHHRGAASSYPVANLNFNGFALVQPGRRATDADMVTSADHPSDPATVEAFVEAFEVSQQGDVFGGPSNEQSQIDTPRLRG